VGRVPIVRWEWRCGRGTGEVVGGCGCPVPRRWEVVLSKVRRAGRVFSGG
jgi:hypothetical protein